MSFRFKDVKTVTKIGLLVLSGVLFLALCTVIARGSLSTIEQTNKSIYEHNLQGIISVKEVIANVRAGDAVLFELMVTKNDGRISELMNEMEKLKQANNVELKKYKAVMKYDEEKKRMQQFESYLKIYREYFNQTMAFTKQKQSEAAYRQYIEKVRPIRESMQSVLNDLVDYNEKLGLNETSKARELADVASRTVLVFAVLGVLVSGVLGFFIVRMVTRPLKQIQHLMLKAEQGDLTVRGSYESRDEIGMLTASFNSMIEGMVTITRTVHERAEELMHSASVVAENTRDTAQATEQINRSVEKMANGAQVQQESSSEIAQALEEFAKGVQSIAENTASMSDVAALSAEQAEQGHVKLQDATKQMKSIEQSVQTTSSVVQQLSERSDKVEQIVEVITTIAGQTNLLALNASIEAARAGEAGRGFAVVAGEVRKLAEQSSSSAAQIAALIADMRTRMAETVSAMGHVRQDVAVGMSVIEQAGDTFAHIVQLVQQVTSQVQEASAATEEMSAGTEEISASVDEMALISATTHNAVQHVMASSEEQSASIETISQLTEQLQVLSKELQLLVNRFKLQ
ncbi:methyl-accepting chemotaxis protein [Paenibacillus sp. 481]|uniref:methyl-accepting chemotaxis protein n=1 Tax=Paenibacillus sp. 481 TaxID=2835869 RepID=UPI001E64D546|nr:methyl-accepting chemotaxis protein [Paenibacillus sp. 481]UHA71812.1 methyl-accepting chemotaxis protein [Paenibacillus sp. 481]